MTETGPFGAVVSTIAEPRLEFAFEVRLHFTRVQTIANMPSGANRGAVYLDSGEFSGPLLRGKAVPHSGGDYALFRPDDTAQFDARYMLQEDDGTLILVQNRGYLWGYEDDTMKRLRKMAFQVGRLLLPRNIICGRFRRSRWRRGSTIGSLAMCLSASANVRRMGI